MTQQVKAQDEKFCHECGAIIRTKAEVCPKCGVRQHGVASPSDKSKIAAGLFAILLGGLGVHKFYLGKVGQGLLYLLFCWSFVPALIGLVEGIIYLSMSDDDFSAKYGT